MVTSLENYKPAECILVLDGRYNDVCERIDAGERARQLIRENPESLVDVYTHAGTLRQGATPVDAANDPQ